MNVITWSKLGGRKFRNWTIGSLSTVGQAWTSQGAAPVQTFTSSVMWAFCMSRRRRQGLR